MSAEADREHDACARINAFDFGEGKRGLLHIVERLWVVRWNNYAAKVNGRGAWQR